MGKRGFSQAVKEIGARKYYQEVCGK
jgi:hypothetical protein